MCVLLILAANRHAESSSVKMSLKEKQHFNLWLNWTGTVSEFLRFLTTIDTKYGVDSMKTAIMNNDLMKFSLPKVHSKKNFRKVFEQRGPEITALSCFPMNIV